MKGTARTMDIVDWLVIKDPSKDQRWSLHLPFMFSSWGCLYGRGKCPGMIFNDSKTYSYDTGCCNDGAYLTSPEELKRQQFWVDQLTDDDMPARKLAEVRKRWLTITREDDGSVAAKTRVFEGACIFANKFGEQKDGKIGCAFLHLAARLGEQDVDDVSHTMTMPTVCWQLPIKVVVEEDEYGTISQIVPWDASRWTEEPDPEFDDLQWWCVDDKEAYSHETEPFFRRYAEELEAIVGKEAWWALILPELEKRFDALVVEPMPAAGPQGRSLIPLAVIGRKELRSR